MIFTCEMSITRYHSMSGRLKGRPAMSQGIQVGRVCDVAFEGQHAKISIRVDDDMVPRVHKHGLKVHLSGGFGDVLHVNDVKLQIDGKTVIDKHAADALAYAIKNAFTPKTPKPLAFKEEEQFRQEYMAQFEPEEPPPPCIVWEINTRPQHHYERYEAWSNHDTETLFYGSSAEEAVERARAVLSKKDPVYNSCEIIQGRDYDKHTMMHTMGKNLHPPLGPKPTPPPPPPPKTDTGWRPTINNPAKAKFIVCENVGAGHNEPDTGRWVGPWRARPEGQMMPEYDGDTPEEAVENLKMGAPWLEELPHIVVGGDKMKMVRPQTPTDKPVVSGPRAERTLEM